jgi:hypothetical protein
MKFLIKDYNKEERRNKMAKEDWRCGGGAAAGGGAVYGLGLIGALVYYIQNATSFVDALWGIVQALLWPAFLIYHVLDLLKL